MSKVFLVEGCGLNTGRVYAVFASREDADIHRKSIREKTITSERTCFHGQADRPGFNR